MVAADLRQMAAKIFDGKEEQFLSNNGSRSFNSIFRRQPTIQDFGLNAALDKAGLS